MGIISCSFECIGCYRVQLCWQWVTVLLSGKTEWWDGLDNVYRAFPWNGSKQTMGELFPIWFPIFLFNWIGPNLVKDETAWESSSQYCLYQQLRVLTSPSWQPGLTHTPSGCCQLPLDQSTVWIANVVWGNQTPPQVAAYFIKFLLSQ